MLVHRQTPAHREPKNGKSHIHRVNASINAKPLPGPNT